MFKFCPNCGEKLTEPSKFCPYCGHKLQDEEEKPNQQKETEGPKACASSEEAQKDPLETARCLIDSGQYKEAEAILLSLLEDNPTDLKTRVALLRNKSENFKILEGEEIEACIKEINLASEITKTDVDDSAYLSFLKRREELKEEKQRKAKEEAELAARKAEEQKRNQKREKEALAAAMRSAELECRFAFAGYFKDGWINFGHDPWGNPWRWRCKILPNGKEAMLFSQIFTTHSRTGLSQFLDRIYNDPKVFSLVEKAVVNKKNSHGLLVPTIEDFDFMSSQFGDHPGVEKRVFGLGPLRPSSGLEASHYYDWDPCYFWVDNAPDKANAHLGKRYGEPQYGWVDQENTHVGVCAVMFVKVFAKPFGF